jgi:hypothetical protein
MKPKSVGEIKCYNRQLQAPANSYKDKRVILDKDVL